jgi:hypothetical protein
MNRRSAFVVLTVVAVLVGATPAASSTVAILPLVGANAGEAEGWTNALRDAVPTLGFDAVASAVVVDAMATASALTGSCNASTVACIARVGSLATADLAVGGRIDGAGAGVRLTLTAVDVATGSVLRQTALTTTSVPDPAAARLVLLRAIAPEKECGYVAVAGATAGATISVDGIPRGEAPLAELLCVPPGRHEIAVDSFDRDSVVKAIDVAFGDTVVVDVAPAPTPGTGPGGPGSATTAVADEDQGEAAADRDRRTTLCIRRVTSDATELAGVAARFDDRLRRLVQRNRKIRLVPLPLVEQEIDDRISATLDGGDDRSRTLRERCLQADFVVEVRLTTMGKATLLVVRAVPRGSAQVRSADAVLQRADIELELSDVAPALLRQVFAPEGLRFRRPPRGGLPPWIFWTTLGSGAALGAVTAGAATLYAVDGFTDSGSADTRTGLGLTFAVGLAATVALGVAAAVEAPQLP